ncbi:MAG TPA: hypothetical protein VNA28_03305 [Solirubrobacteraceae bacterium]|nr:hypothetical protein [Solirubrobacteraceae bacterium]
MRRLLLLTALLAAHAAIVAAPAQAAFFPGDAIDGPSADIRSLGDLDLARDGTGALAYVKSVEGVAHIFVARFEEGVFKPGERIDGALAAEGSQPVVGASDAGRLVVVFVSGGVVHGVVRVAGAWSAPVPLGSGADPAVDLSINGTGYATFTAAGDVRVARLDRRTHAWTVIAQPADVDPARAAGVGNGRSRVAISADGIGVVTWGEGGRVYARKMFGGGLSTAPQDLTPADFEGRVPVLSDLPDIDAEDDSSYAWVVFRQSFADGGTRILARRQRGTSFEPAVAVDENTGEPVGRPRIDINGRGVGAAMTTGATSGQPMWSMLERDAFGPGARIFAPSAAAPAVMSAMAENNDGVLAAVLGGPGEAPAVRVRTIEDGKAGAKDEVLSRPELGPVVPALGFDVASDRGSGVVVAWVQGGADDRRIVAGYNDRPPGFFAGYTSQRCCQNPLPRLSWQPSFSLWGAVKYVVSVDGTVVGETTQTFFTPTAPIIGPTHKWQVQAVDLRGQTKRMRTRGLRIDDLLPLVRVGYKRSRRVVTLGIRARDPDQPGHHKSGLASVVVSWGDGSQGVRSTAGRLRTRHRYSGSGTFALTVTGRDRAGNERVVTRTVRIAGG